MIIHNVGYNHNHDADFFIERPDGSGDNLLLLLKTPAIFNLNGTDTVIPENTFFLFRKGSPQFYRCLPQHTFSNDWIHFLFEDGEEEAFLSLGLAYETPIPLSSIFFQSFCIKCIANEVYSNTLHKKSSISHYMFLMFNKVSEQLSPVASPDSNNAYEMLSTIRNKIYASPNEPRTVYSAAHEVRMSKSNFQLLYKKYFHITFMQDLINSRVEYAKMLLLSTNLSSMDISKQCGYNYYAHFARQFKELTGTSPMEFRNQNKSCT